MMMIDLSALKGYVQGQTHLRVSENFKTTFTSNKEKFICWKNWKLNIKRDQCRENKVNYENTSFGRQMEDVSTPHHSAAAVQ